jgi:hypothetical protein
VESFPGAPGGRSHQLGDFLEWHKGVDRSTRPESGGLEMTGQDIGISWGSSAARHIESIGLLL